MARWLALDPASRTGWAVAEPAGGDFRIEVGSWQLTKGTIQQKCESVIDQLGGFLSRVEIEYAAVEIPVQARPNAGGGKFFGQPDGSGGTAVQATNQLWAIHGAVIATLRVHRVPYRAVGLKTWRAAALGNGNMKAEEAKKLCREKLEARGVRVPNVDAAEAGGILFWLINRVERFKLEDKVGDRSAA